MERLQFYSFFDGSRVFGDNPSSYIIWFELAQHLRLSLVVAEASIHFLAVDCRLNRGYFSYKPAILEFLIPGSFVLTQTAVSTDTIPYLDTGVRVGATNF